MQVLFPFLIIKSFLIYCFNLNTEEKNWFELTLLQDIVNSFNLYFIAITSMLAKLYFSEFFSQRLNNLFIYFVQNIISKLNLTHLRTNLSEI